MSLKLSVLEFRLLAACTEFCLEQAQLGNDLGGIRSEFSTRQIRKLFDKLLHASFSPSSSA